MRGALKSLGVFIDKSLTCFTFVFDSYWLWCHCFCALVFCQQFIIPGIVAQQSCGAHHGWIHLRCQHLNEFGDEIIYQLEEERATETEGQHDQAIDRTLMHFMRTILMGIRLHEPSKTSFISSWVSLERS